MILTVLLLNKFAIFKIHIKEEEKLKE